MAKYVILVQIVLSPTERESVVIASVLLGITGTLFLTYGQLGRENGPVRWFTLDLTCGLLRALVFTP
jgi:K+ transporter